MTKRMPQPVHDAEASAPAPGDLELVRSFLSLHDHEPGGQSSLPPSEESVEWWMREHGLLGEDERTEEQDLTWALEVRHALRAWAFENMGRERDAAAIELLDAAARRTGLQVSFGGDREPLRTTASGVRGSVGRLLAISLLAGLEDDWRLLRECGSAACLAVFYDRSKNHSGKWCSMQTCGNRNKVRRFRERRAGRPAAT